MLFLASFLLATIPSRVDAVLRKADAELALLDPYPLQSVQDNLPELLDRYQNIVAERGAMPRAEAGIGHCLSLLGRYKEAADAYGKAGPRYAGHKAEALLYTDVASKIDKRLDNLFVRQLRHVPDSNEWIATLDEPQEEGDFPGKTDATEVAEFIRDDRSKELIPLGESFPAEYYLEPRFCTLYLVHLAAGSKEWHPLLFHEGEGDCTAVTVDVFSLTPKGLKNIQSFHSYQPSWVRPANVRRGLIVASAPYIKTAWTDIYEWTGNGFQLGNRHNPEFFGKNGVVVIPRRRDQSYSDWMIAAAQLDIYGQFERGAKAWRRALTLYGRIKPYESDDAATDRVFGNGGDVPEEIHQRLQWLKAHDYDHPFLYRPLDDGLEIPLFWLRKALKSK